MANQAGVERWVRSAAILLACGSGGSAIKAPSASKFSVPFFSFSSMLLRNHHVKVLSLTNGVDLSGSVVWMRPHVVSRRVCPAKVVWRGWRALAQFFYNLLPHAFKADRLWRNLLSFHQSLISDQKLEKSKNTVHHLASSLTRSKTVHVSCVEPNERRNMLCRFEISWSRPTGTDGCCHILQTIDSHFPTRIELAPSYVDRVDSCRSLSLCFDTRVYSISRCLARA